MLSLVKQGGPGVLDRVQCVDFKFVASWELVRLLYELGNFSVVLLCRMSNLSIVFVRSETCPWCTCR